MTATMDGRGLIGRTRGMVGMDGVEIAAPVIGKATGAGGQRAAMTADHEVFMSSPSRH